MQFWFVTVVTKYLTVAFLILDLSEEEEEEEEEDLDDS
jgi:hypothetical protein